MDDAKRSAPLEITLALEGGGALGAFTWGVLERLLDVPSLRIAVVSGTSAGAMNGAMLVQGLARGGAAEARDLMETFWQRVAIAAGSVPGPAAGWLAAISGPMLDAVRKAGSAIGTPTPTPFTINPLRGILSELLHPPLFGTHGAPELVVAATRVRTGEARLFRGGEIGVDTLLASACLPLIFPAVEIDGEAYWDGGYSSNPPVRPLIEAGAPADILIIRTMPGERLAPPFGAAAVKDRLSEITFGTPLRAELHSLALAKRSLAGVSELPPTLARLRDARVHMISPAAADARDASAALTPSWPVLTLQRRRGHAAAERWIEEHLPALGHRASFPLELFADPVAASAAGSRHPILQGADHAT